MNASRVLPWVGDRVVLEGTKRWIDMVVRYDFCPFVNSFWKKRSIVVEQAHDPETLVQHSMRFLDDKTSNVMLIVLPTCPIPSRNSNFSHVPNDMITANVMGPVLTNFRNLLTARHLRACNFNPNGPIIDVVFNPWFVGTANWSPWPVIQLVKNKVMKQAEESYQKSHSDGGRVGDITFDNMQKTKCLTSDHDKFTIYWRDVAECYGGTLPAFYAESIK